ncbi:MAG: transglutaminase domain-containing protein [Myxococcales bacterium]|nr:transglutaminase domain-containing protein [Myxococcales bacterium]
MTSGRELGGSLGSWSLRLLVAGTALYAAAVSEHTVLCLALATLAVVPARLALPASTHLALSVLLGGLAFVWVARDLTGPPAQVALRLLPPFVLLGALAIAVFRLWLGHHRGDPGRITAAATLVAATALAALGPRSAFPLFVLPYLMLAFLTLRLLDPGRPSLLRMDRRNLAFTAATVALAATLTTGFAVGIPPLHARVEAAAVDYFGGRLGGAQSGFGRTIQLGELKGLMLSDETVLRVYGPHVDHLRGVVYQHYRGGIWAEALGSPRPIERFPRAQPATPPAARVERVMREDRIFVPLVVGDVHLPDGSARVDAFGVLTAPEEAPWDWVAFTPAAGERPPVALPSEDDLRVPEDIVDDLTALARAWTASATPGRGQLEALAAHLGDGYRYSLEHDATPGVDPVLDFLTTHKEGHCELFASSFALLARALGIPARVAAGFRVTERNEWTEHWVVRGRNAHAWVEAYVDDAWETFDPTPPAALAMMARRATGLSALWDAAGAAFAAAKAFVLERSVLDLGLVALALLAWLFRRELATLLRRRRPQVQVELRYSDPLACFEALSAGLAARGITRRPDEPLEALAERAAALGPEPRRLVLAYAALRYGGVGDAAGLATAVEAWQRTLE